MICDLLPRSAAAIASVVVYIGGVKGWDSQALVGLDSLQLLPGCGACCSASSLGKMSHGMFVQVLAALLIAIPRVSFSCIAIVPIVGSDVLSVGIFAPLMLPL